MVLDPGSWHQILSIYSGSEVPHHITETNNLVGTGQHSADGNVSGYRCILAADPGIASSIPARSDTFVEIDHEIISIVILQPSAESFKKGFCQLQEKVCAQSTG